MTATDDRPFADFDPLESDAPDNALATYARLRAQCPVARTDAYGGYWALTRHADVTAAASDSRTWISSVRAVVPSDPRGLRRPPLNFDAPAHTPYRRALDRTLQRARITALEPRLRAHAARELAPMLARGGGDVAQEFGARFPAWVTTEWLNLPDDVAPRLADTATAWVRAWRRMDGPVVNAMSERMYTIARDLVRDRRASPLPVESDPASSLLAERHEGAPLDEEHLVGALRQSLVVGMVAPPILLGSICVHLAQDHDLQERLRAAPELLPDAIEEFLRLYTPYRGFARTVAHDVELHGRQIRPGEPVTLVYASANRDAEVFDDPDSFVLGRPNIAAHLGFGRGRHRCAGAPLARLALRIALGELLAATSGFVLDGPLEGARMPEIGYVSVPLRLTPA
ncbi:cytochrome P450 [Cryptosporangium aurantiacum]|uniref:Cytochrome P450 n=1 Tax=Cryptosporangium aurantiacum TaxID=134849 RepID=A0A1M7R2D8_9ACTN|nr:cytochrome P450 [Cryptosporangium aurantiacum]SHN39139.1 Cytochrome P450 [Cryptosporangium aurantiacum]